MRETRREKNRDEAQTKTNARTEPPHAFNDKPLSFGMPLQDIGRYGAVGFEFVASVGAGFFIGRAIDQHYATNGVAMWIVFFLGVLSGFLLLVRTARALESQASNDDAASNISASANPTEISAEDRLKKKLEAVEADIDHDDEKERDA
jgi:F0F1-type ATP synthase assembly protein I